jgi:omega-6 fatty acid desaturase (delta-12 desaturase)
MSSTQNPPHQAMRMSDWKNVLKPYQQPDLKRSLWQIINTFVPFFIVWYLSYLSLNISYALTLFGCLIGGLLTIRIFIIFHDCGHGSFFKQQKWNDTLGLICSLFVLTPYHRWRHGHAIHHATNGDLDRRGIGDVKTLTVNEYLALSPWHRFRYRVYRHPLVLFGIGPTLVFVLSERLCERDDKPRERWSVHWTNVALVLVIAAGCLWLGPLEFLLVQVPMTIVASSVGVWLFYVQHQFEDTYWEHHEDWEFVDAALIGSSFYRLPKVLQWFSGNIGFHHIHHLSARIPNYRLEECFANHPQLQQVTTLTLKSSFECINLTLWDEAQNKLVGFNQIRKASTATAD